MLEVLDPAARRTVKTSTLSHDAAVYGWGTAAFRWFQGAVGGLLTALGLGAIS
jgi:hypothetical protein